jgi:hypothetical protein
MKSDLNYIYYIQKKYKDAVEILVTGEKDSRSRVQAAYYIFWHIQLNEYPESLRKKVELISKILTRLPGREGFMLDDNFRKMKNKTASKAAKMIYDVYLDMESHIKESELQNDNIGIEEK